MHKVIGSRDDYQGRKQKVSIMKTNKIEKTDQMRSYLYVVKKQMKSNQKMSWHPFFTLLSILYYFLTES